jgi:hypothetical protein
MYAEAIDNAKLRLLAYEDRWHFVALLCLKAQGILDERNLDLRGQKVCVKLGLNSVELETVMKRLVTVGLVSEDMQPLKWTKRQFQSDSSTSRVRAFRKRFSNGAVTPPDTDTDTDTEKDKTKKALRASSTVPADFIPDTSFAASLCPDMDVEAEVAKFRDHEFRKPRKDWNKALRNWVRTCKESGKYARKSKLPPGFQDVEWN